MHNIIIVCIYNVEVIIFYHVAIIWHSVSAVRLNFSTSITACLCHDSVLGTYIYDEGSVYATVHVHWMCTHGMYCR
jgi:hypothetical protein